MRSLPRVGPIVSESRTIAQPVGVVRVLSSVLVPGSYTRAVGTLIPNGPKRNPPAWRSSNAPNTLAESKRGTHSQSTVPSSATSAPVWQLDRKAKSAIGGNGDGAAALCGICFLGVGCAAVLIWAFQSGAWGRWWLGCSTGTAYCTSSASGDLA
jgi:hypothetical protein